MEKSDSIKELAAALAKAQGEMKNAPKDSQNPHFRSRYADLASIVDASRPALAKHGLSVLQLVSGRAPEVTIRTVLAHETGEWIASEMTMVAAQNTPQAVGSCVTYARRYALAAMVGIAPDDDDGNAASATGSAPAAQSAPSPTEPPPYDAPPPWTPPASASAAMSNTAAPGVLGDTIVDVQAKTGPKKDGSGTYTRFTIVTSRGQKLGTFDRKLADAAEMAMKSGEVVDLEWKAKGDYTDLVAIRPKRNGAPAPAPAMAVDENSLPF